MKLWINGLIDFSDTIAIFGMKYGKLVNNWIRLSEKKDENEFLPAHLELIETPFQKDLA